MFCAARVRDRSRGVPATLPREPRKVVSTMCIRGRMARPLLHSTLVITGLGAIRRPGDKLHAAQKAAR